MHLILIGVDIAVLSSLVKSLKSLYPFFYRKVRTQIFSFFIFVIIILAIRVIAFIVLFVDHVHIIDIVNSLSQTIYLSATEIIPCVVVSFSLILKTFRNDSVTFSVEDSSTNIAKFG